MPAPDMMTPVINPGTYAYMERRQGANGKQQKALALKRESLLAALRANGTAKEATVLNFNPVPLRLEGGISYKVPSVTDESVPPQARLKFKYKGKEFPCTYLTITEPFIYPIIRDVTLKQGEDPADGVGVYDVLPCRQIEIAHLFWHSNNNGDKGGSGMGGVVIFEGNRHSIKKALDGDDVQINVPTFIKLPNNQREYFTEPKSFMQVMGDQLDRARTYWLNEMQTASIYNNDEDQRKNITQVMRIGHQWALDRGLMTKVEPWLLSQSEPDETCLCGAGRKAHAKYFCHACQRPFDPFQAYMDKELGIDSVHMQRIKDEQWPIVRKEEKRRQALRTGESEEKSKG